MYKRLRAAAVATGVLLALATGTAAAAQAASPAPTAASASASAAGARNVAISTNYAWLRGTITWDSRRAVFDGTIHDTPQLASHSWFRIAFKEYVSGTWRQRYFDDPSMAVSNGGSRTDSWGVVTHQGVKDFWLDLCSKRNGETYCTGWK
ncbi:hypothetical protein [Streptomyces sp. M92]|uniref:hypothetical protein n=1 Tax=Streptomyces sp. M92 TaxID=2944250 RepID=UPI00234BDCDD|nr:hypothetical protein [Streptomyces sp. M92]WCN05172.1 hypothetical protein M6G08_25405 [Streptomyces sp. M92]